MQRLAVTALPRLLARRSAGNCIRPLACSYLLSAQRHALFAPTLSAPLRRLSDFAAPAATLKPVPALKDVPAFELSSELERLSSGFANARMDIEDAGESVGSTYYPADIASAQKAVQDVLDLYATILAQLGKLDRTAEVKSLRESWSLRLEQLKAELEAAVQAGGADH